jgi:cytochrome c5
VVTSSSGAAIGSFALAPQKSDSVLAAADIHAVVVYLRSIPPLASADLPATLAAPAPALPNNGGGSADVLGKRVFEEACASCHDWTGVSVISQYATISGSRAVNDPEATNVAQIVISGTRRVTPHGIISMPAFGAAYRRRQTEESDQRLYPYRLFQYRKTRNSSPSSGQKVR